MRTPDRFVSLASIFVASLLHVATAHAQIDQRVLADDLLHGNQAERSSALEAARMLGPQQTGAELRSALFRTLEREASLRVRQYEADLRGEFLELEDPEFISRIARVVAELRDPRAISALAAALGTGATVIPAALAAFGEQAAPAVLAMVTAPKSTHYAVEDGLVSLRFMLEGAAPGPLSVRTLEQIRAAAEQRLTGDQYFTVVWRAIDLAAVIKDPRLIHILHSIANDRDEVIARGIEDPDLVELTQKRAADRLAGVPPRPRWRRSS